MRTFRRLGPFIAGPLAAIVFLTLGAPYARAQDPEPPTEEPVESRERVERAPISEVPLPEDVTSELDGERPLSREELEMQERLRDAAPAGLGEAPAPENAAYALPTGEAKSAVTPSRISLPNAEGSVEGMGESFAPVLSSGTATFSVPIALPAGRNGVQPSLGLSYASTGGNSCVGFGWNLSVPFIVRQSDLGLPRYIDQDRWHGREDRFFYNGGQELVPVDSGVAAAVDSFGNASGYNHTERRPDDVPASWQQYRARIEGGFMRFFRSPDATRWVVQGKDGTRFDFGLLPVGAGPTDLEDAASLQTQAVDGSGPVYKWLLTRMSDVFGSTVYYQYRASSGGQRTLDDVYYLSPNSCKGSSTQPSAANSDAARDCSAALADFGVRVHLDYQPRVDAYTSYTSGWGIANDQRLRRVVVTAAGAMDTIGDRQLVRRYHLTYDDTVFHSLLGSVQVEGRPDTEQTGGTATWHEFTNVDESTALGSTIVGRLLPAMTFDYTDAPAGPIPGHGGVASAVYDIPNSPSVSADAARADLFDVNTDGLPDLVVTDPARYRTADGAPAAGVFFNGFSGGDAAPASAGSFSDAVPVGVPAGLSGVLNMGSRTVIPMDVEGDGRSDFLHLPRRDRYGFFAPTRMSDATTGNAVRPSQQGWRFTYADVVLPTGADPRIDLVREPERYRTMDVNGDHLIDILKTSGRSMQTWLNLGMVPGGEGQFGQAIWNESTQGWDLSNDPHETCLMHDGLPLDFSDPELRTSDMNGDGLVDLVRLRRGRLLYWPARGTTMAGAPVFGLGPRDCGAGFASGREIRMQSPPAEINVELDGVYLSDVNGDGAADVVQVRFNEVDVYFNEGGEGFTDRVTIATPAAPGFSPNVRLADIDGSGTLDVVYTNAGRWKYIDLAGGTRARLLNRVQNGLGASTVLTYGSSADDYLADLAQADGDPGGENFTWSKVDGACDRVLSTTTATGPAAEQRGDCVYRSGGSPVISTVVRQVETDDHFDELGRERNLTQTQFAYHDGYYEGIEQEFRGFGAADAIAHGDVHHPTAVTRTYFRQGRRPTAIASDRLADNPREALKGRQWLSEVFDEGGTYLSSSHATIRIRHLMEGLDGRGIYYGFVSQTDTLQYGTTNGMWGSGSITLPSVETDAADPSTGAVGTAVEEESRTIQIRMADWAHIRSATTRVDNVGQVRIQEAHGRIADAAGSAADPVLRQVLVPYLRDAYRWVWAPLHQYGVGAESCAGSACRLGFTSFYYGFGPTVLRTTTRAHIPDGTPAYAFAGDGFGAEDFGSVGDQTLVSSTNYDQWGSPDESCAGAYVALDRPECARYASVEYDDAYAQLPLKESIAVHGSTSESYCDGSVQGSAHFCMVSTTATWDRGFGALLTATDPNGRSSTVEYDGLGRLAAVRPPDHPGDSCATRPTQTFEYTLLADGLPVSMVESITHNHCTTSFPIQSRSYVDGLGRPRASIQRGEYGIGGGGRRWAQSGIARLSVRGTATTSYNPAWIMADPPNPAAAVAIPDEPYAEQYHDAFGRVVRAIERDESESHMVYGALETTAMDPLDTGINGAGADNFLGTGTTTRTDGHGRTIDQVLVNRLPGQGALDNQYYRLFTRYRNDGAVLAVKRVQTATDAAVDYASVSPVSGNVLERLFTYDTLGRRIGTVDPDSDSQAPGAAAATKGWRYLFNTVGDLIAVRDARGCGQNFYYDHAGRLVAEDYVECTESESVGDHPLMDDGLDGDSFAQVGVTPVASVQPDVRHYFDSVPWYVTTGDMDAPPSGADFVGRLTGSVDRGQRSAVDYDLRGRPTWSARQMAVLPDPGQAVTSLSASRPQLVDGSVAPPARVQREYDTAHTYISTSSYDRIDRPVGLTLPTDPDYGGTGPVPEVGGTMSYNTRGLPYEAHVDIDTWHRKLWTRRYYEHGGERLMYLRGDTGEVSRLTKVNFYDDRLRPTRSYGARHPDLVDQTPGSTDLQSIRFPIDYRYTWDAADNLAQVVDLHRPWEWPTGISAEYQPTRATIEHDALYRVVGVDFDYRTSANRWSSTPGPATDWREEQAHHEAADPMRRKPAPMVSDLPAQRPVNFTYQYDWLANQTEWTDDANAFYERSLGSNILNGHEAGKRPAALYFAGNIMSGGGVDPLIDRGGWVSLEYGESGNVLSMTVRGQCHDTMQLCDDPGGTDPDARDLALATDCACDVEHHYQYRWDELNRLAEARRYDRGTGLTDWEIQVRQRYRYDGANVRMVKQTRDQMSSSGDGTDGVARAALYVYPGDFERRGLQVGGVGDEWVEGAIPVETQYLIAGSRLVWKEGATPGSGGTGFENEARLTYAVTNLIQSTSAVIDLFSGQLLERGTYYPNGARETLRTERGEGFSLEPMGFTGKEGDDEVGLVYFGERYLMPHLGRWASPDPLQVHAGGGGEFGNSYHYVGGSLLQARDPLGLSPPDGRVPSARTQELFDMPLEETRMRASEARDRLARDVLQAGGVPDWAASILARPGNAPLSRGRDPRLRGRGTIFQANLMLTFTSNPVAQALALHFVGGSGQPYVMSALAVKTVQPGRVSFAESLQPQIDAMTEQGGGSQVVRADADVNALTRGTLGQFHVYAKGTLTVGEDGSWSFDGNAVFYDVYDFDAHEGGVTSRSDSGEARVTAVRENIAGTEFYVFSEAIPVRQASYPDDRFVSAGGTVFAEFDLPDQSAPPNNDLNLIRPPDVEPAVQLSH